MASAEPVCPLVQLEIRTPFAPAVIPSGDRNFLFYELHIENFSD